MRFQQKKILILGATSHIAKGLIYNFNEHENLDMIFYARNIEKLKSFLGEIGYKKTENIIDISNLQKKTYDVIINCVGIGEPEKLIQSGSEIFNISESFDQLVIDYLKKSKETLYINFSSGAVYGTDFTEPANIEKLTYINVNKIEEIDYYRIAKMNSEAKHRSLKDLKIIDLRIFNYFSRFINLESKFFISELIYCIKNDKIFYTTNNDMSRDYIHHFDLVNLIVKCIEFSNLNDVFDVYSLSPIGKMEIIKYFSENYNFKIKYNDDNKITNASGLKNIYYSENKKAENIGYLPKYSSMECIIEESKILLEN